MRALRILVVVAALAVVAYLIWSIWDHEALMAWVGKAPPLPFFALMALLPAFGVPLTPFFLLAGATFGVKVGLLGSWGALALNLIICYWVARSRLRGLESLLRRFGQELPDFTEKESGALRFTFMIKVAPGIPGFLKNWGLAASGVPFSIYMGVGMAVTGLYAAALVSLGESMFDHDLTRTLVAAGILVGVVALLWWLHRRRLGPRSGQLV